MSEMDIPSVNAIASSYAALVSRLQVERYEVPLNAVAESAKVQAAFTSTGRHDPKFEYVVVDERAYHELTAFAESHDFSLSPWLAPMRTTLEYMIATVEDCRSHRGDAIARRTERMYGGTTAETVDLALGELETPYTAVDEVAMDADAAARLFRAALERVRLDEWSVAVESEMNAMMDVSAERHEIRLRKRSTFTPTMVTRLIVHEVGGHVFRAASGVRQPIQTLGLGIGDYLPTEEGLACYQEDRFGLSDPVDSRRLALRYLAAHLSAERPLFDVYSELRQYADHDQAFETAVRAKRGFSETSERGAHLKDKVYFEGKWEVARHLSLHPDDVSSLYVGKVSLSMLPLVNRSIASGVLLPPAFHPGLIPSLLE